MARQKVELLALDFLPCHLLGNSSMFSISVRLLLFLFADLISFLILKWNYTGSIIFSITHVNAPVLFRIISVSFPFSLVIFTEKLLNEA